MTDQLTFSLSETFRELGYGFPHGPFHIPEGAEFIPASGADDGVGLLRITIPCDGFAATATVEFHGAFVDHGISRVVDEAA